MKVYLELRVMGLPTEKAKSISGEMAVKVPMKIQVREDGDR